jgi:HAMP domain-containing protein
MAYHVPFSQRHPSPPIYIGFEAPRVRRRRFNWWGFSGLVLSILSVFSLFLLAPIALLISLMGLRRRPRGMAAFGTLFSVGGTAILALAIAAGVAGHQRKADQHRRHVAQRALAAKIAETRATLAAAAKEIERLTESNNDVLPDGLEGNTHAVGYRDAWKRELRYDLHADGCILRSSGPDGRFETNDDQIHRIPGTTPDEPIRLINRSPAVD